MRPVRPQTHPLPPVPGCACATCSGNKEKVKRFFDLAVQTAINDGNAVDPYFADASGGLTLSSGHGHGIRQKKPTHPTPPPHRPGLLLTLRLIGIRIGRRGGDVPSQQPIYSRMSTI